MLSDLAHIVQARREKRAQLQKAARTVWRAYHAATLAGASRFTLFKLARAYDQAENDLEAFNHPAGYVDVFATDDQGEWTHV